MFIELTVNNLQLTVKDEKPMGFSKIKISTYKKVHHIQELIKKLLSKI